MGSFLFLMTEDGGDAHVRGENDWVVRGPCRARITNDGYGPDATLVDSSAGLAAGLVRLDNRREISQLAACDIHQSDLAIVVAALARHGPGCIQRFEGDFTFAYWDPNLRHLIAARDSLGIRALYHASDPPGQAFASHAQLIGTGRSWSFEYIADYLAGALSRAYTPYDGVRRVPPGTYRVVHDGKSTEHRYWSPYQFDTTWVVDGRHATDQFAALFKEAMRPHLTDQAGCWSQLSGGLDSSAVVSMAGWLANVDRSVPGLRGTVTFVETVGIGDERRYSDAVIRDWPHRNEQIVDYSMWQEDRAPAPETDEPETSYPLFARDQLLSRIVCSAGSRVLLTGVGPDHYLHGDYSYFVDWIARGRIRDATREMYHEAIRNKVSFWKLAYRHGVKPFLPQRSRNSSHWSDWVHPSFARRFPIDERDSAAPERLGTTGRRFVTQTADAVNFTEFSVSRGFLGSTLDVRYPFLSRPLVEFCLQLPPEMKVSDGKHKWILREAMRGILPEEVRRRTSKGFINVGIDRALTSQHARLDALLERSVLGEMGCIDVSLARKALAQRSQRRDVDNGHIENLLTLETWLSVKSGRWTASATQRFATSQAQVVCGK